MKSIERARRAGEKNRAAAVTTGRHLCPAVGTYSVDGNNPLHLRARRLVGHKSEQSRAIGGLLLWVYWAKPEQSFTRARPGPERRGLVRADGGIAPIENEGSLPRESS